MFQQSPLLDPLLADLFGNIAGTVLVIFWLAVQFISSRQEAKKNRPQLKQGEPKQGAPKQRQPQQQPQRRGGPQPQQIEPAHMAQGQRQPRNQQDALRNEVEEFLRRAQGKPDRPQPTGSQATGSQAVQQEPAREQRQMPAPASVSGSLSTSSPLSSLSSGLFSEDPPPRHKKTERKKQQRGARPLPDEVPTLRSEGVAEHVARHLSTQDIVEHTQTLGSKVANSDDRLALRLHEKFDHSVGHLQRRETTVDAKPPQADIAAEVAAMLRSPQGVRQLIIANEILRRPEW